MQKPGIAHLLGRGKPVVSSRQFGAAHRVQLFGKKLAGTGIRPVAIAQLYGDFKMRLQEIERLHRGVEPYFDRSVLLPEGPQLWHQPIGREGRIAAQAHSAGAFGIQHFKRHILDLAEKRDQPAAQCAPHRGQRDRAGVAVEKAHLQIVFERGNLPADRHLRHPHLPRRGRECLMPCGDRKRP